MTVAFSPMPDARDDVLRLALEASGLPTDDLNEPGRRFFKLSDVDGPIGFVGIEGAGPDRLLRSFVALPSRKRLGNGGRLLAHAEAVACRDGVERLHLLTTVADFFRSRGYCDADRVAAPESIRATAQFSTLCPGSAAYLVKEIA